MAHRLEMGNRNIHQLMTSRYNYRNYMARGYTLLRSPEFPVMRSELTALNLMKYALDHHIILPINYCSSLYKQRLQGKGNRERIASSVKGGLEKITGSGYLRRLSIQGSPEALQKVMHNLQEKKHWEKRWSWNDDKTEIVLHESLLGRIGLDGSHFVIRTFEPKLKMVLRANETGREIVLNADKKVFIKKEHLTQKKGLSAVAIKTFQKLFVENLGERKAFSYFLNNHPYFRLPDERF